MFLALSCRSPRTNGFIPETEVPGPDTHNLFLTQDNLETEVAELLWSSREAWTGVLRRKQRRQPMLRGRRLALQVRRLFGVESGYRSFKDGDRASGIDQRADG